MYYRKMRICCIVDLLLLTLMCGIFCCAKDDTLPLSDLRERLKVANGARGPDSQETVRVEVTGSGVLDLFASELRLRGSHPVVQPHQDNEKNILCWNGEIAEDENDGVKLSRALTAVETVEECAALFGTIEGPYAFVYYQATSRRLFFARDPVGRRSLLIHKPSIANPYFLLASVSTGLDPASEFEELSTDYIFCLELGKFFEMGDLPSAFDSCLTSLPRNSTNGALYSQPTRVNTEMPPDDWPLIADLETPDYLLPAAEDLITHLGRSVELRVRDIPQPCPGAARLAVLFSGGIDCTIIAFLAHRYIPSDQPIDLLNVAFENPRKLKNQAKKQSNVIQEAYMVPDRVTGLEEVEELRKLCPRVWNFVQVNVPYEEFQASRSLVESLMFPSRTVMDLVSQLSVWPSALYFASRGKGVIRDSNSEPVPYTTPARVLLNGLGSDELLGGYGRHRSAYNTGGWKGLIDELQLEIDRIPTRNLGRDDRVIACHGKETRHPFLSLTLIDFLARLPVHLKVDPRVPPAAGDKMLLRLAARKLGLVEASSRKKRAMQFGSHSAKMDGERRGDVAIDL
ncbi:asparagine synthase-domain-containing protein [Roridomyces roridus]|uniref:Asparagine synthase-domain-containing protein n=1 Tax=Roridomyces roridus TaxID=1738132 RepID=A0AAD7FPG5_9AGAR|nr:asparagine synthase-domain-containing protein [Roridomyces roridus]